MQGRLSPIQKGKIQAFPWKNWQKEFEIGKKLKFNIMEWTLDFDKLYSNPIMTANGKEKIKYLKKKYNFEIPSLTGDCFMQRPFWKFKKKERTKLQNDFLNIIDNCSSIGVKKIVIPLVDNGKLTKYKEKKILVTFLKKITKYLKKKNIQILFESDFEPKKYLEFIKKFDTKIFGINYDTGNSAAMGFCPNEEINIYGQYIRNVHIKDRLFRGKTVPLGTGDVNFQSVFKNLSKINYRGNYILQTARSYKNQHAQVLVKSSHYLHQFLKNNQNV